MPVQELVQEQVLEPEQVQQQGPEQVQRQQGPGQLLEPVQALRQQVQRR